MEIRIKRLSETAQMPTRAHATDAGYDLYADSVGVDRCGNHVYGTGVAMEIPEGHVGLVFPRSSIARTQLFLTNSVGIIDSGYRGEIMFKFKTALQTVPLPTYNVGERIGQIIIIPFPSVTFVEADELSDSERGEGGYGSSGV